VSNVALQDEVDAIAWSGPDFNRAEFRISMRDAAFEAEHCVNASTQLDTVVPYVTFLPSGDVTDVLLENIPDETLAPCLTAPFTRIKIDPFSGPPVKTHWSFATIHRTDANRRAMINR
jgi:hypothetical protein